MSFSNGFRISVSVRRLIPQFSAAAVIPLIEVTAKLMTLFITLEAAEDTLDNQCLSRAE